MLFFLISDKVTDIKKYEDSNMMKRIQTGIAMLALVVNVNAETSPETVAGTTLIDTPTAHQLFKDGVLFVDVRRQSDWDAGRISSALHLELKSNYTEEELLKEAKKDEKIVIYCNGVECLRSSAASVKAVGWGFTNIQYYRDGFPSWQRAGYPVE